MIGPDTVLGTCEIFYFGCDLSTVVDTQAPNNDSYITNEPVDIDGKDFIDDPSAIEPGKATIDEYTDNIHIY